MKSRSAAFRKEDICIDNPDAAVMMFIVKNNAVVWLDINAQLCYTADDRKILTGLLSIPFMHQFIQECDDHHFIGKKVFCLHSSGIWQKTLQQIRPWGSKCNKWYLEQEWSLITAFGGWYLKAAILFLKECHRSFWNDFFSDKCLQIFFKKFSCL